MTVQHFCRNSCSVRHIRYRTSYLSFHANVFHLAVCSEFGVLPCAMRVPAHMCTTDGTNYTVCNDQNDKVCVSLSACLFYKMFDPSGSIETCTPAHLPPGKTNPVKLLRLPPGAFPSTADPCPRSSGPDFRKTLFLPFTAAAGADPKSQAAAPRQRAMAPKDFFPSS